MARKRGPSKSVHYAGGLRYKLRDGRTATIAPGYAACCSGERAMKVRRDGNHTHDRLWITCLKCLRVLERAEKLNPEARKTVYLVLREYKHRGFSSWSVAQVCSSRSAADGARAAMESKHAVAFRVDAWVTS